MQGSDGCQSIGDIEVNNSSKSNGNFFERAGSDIPFALSNDDISFVYRDNGYPFLDVFNYFGCYFIVVFNSYRNEQQRLTI